jgi:hypothetical protein
MANFFSMDNNGFFAAAIPEFERSSDERVILRKKVRG